MLNLLRALKRPLYRPIYFQAKAYAKSGSGSVRNGPAGLTNAQNQSDSGGDRHFRPSWVYLASHILTYTLIPGEPKYA
jgi:hypothetical protein